MEPELVTITELSKLVNVSRSLIHYYRALGIVVPTNTYGRITVYNKEESLKRLKKVKELQKKGITLLDIQKML